MTFFFVGPTQCECLNTFLWGGAVGTEDRQ